jgi:hypothetical protein
MLKESHYENRCSILYFAHLSKAKKKINKYESLLLCGLTEFCHEFGPWWILQVHFGWNVVSFQKIIQNLEILRLINELHLSAFEHTYSMRPKCEGVNKFLEVVNVQSRELLCRCLYNLQKIIKYPNNYCYYYYNLPFFENQLCSL